MLIGEKVLDHSERSAYRFKELRGNMDLPRVGERVRSKQYGTVWKVIEEKEIWFPEPADKQGKKVSPDLIPAVSLRYWKEDCSQGPGSGKTMFYRYRRIDPSFQAHWEILYDW
ncbi:MAG: hypothetical protein WBN03_20200 [Desulfobacterales bacterium]